MRALRFRHLSVATSVATYLTILVGGYTRGTGSGYGCRDAWPLCAHPVTGDLHLFPDWTNAGMVIEWSHRFVALVAGILILWMAIAAWRHHRHDKRTVTAATIAGVLLPVQALLGAMTVWYFTTGRHGLLATIHMGTAAALFSAVVATTIFAYYPRTGRPTTAGGGASSEPHPVEGPAKATPRDYAAMLKPRIIVLLCAMAVTGMALAPASAGLTVQTAFWTLLGGAMAAGGAGVVNQVIERDLDARMPRTRDRPLATGRIQVSEALAFALALVATSATMLAFMVNVLTAVLVQLGVVLYVFVYTLWLKPSTPQGVVWGGAAGSVPAIAGFAAVTGEVGLPALLLAGLVFLWQPPHFWALALFRRDEYGHAGFPMMPNVRGVGHTKKQMVLWTLFTVLCAGLFYPLGFLGTFYLATSTVLGLAYLFATLQVVLARETRDAARRCFFVSIAYLGLLFGAMVVDRFLF